MTFFLGIFAKGVANLKRENELIALEYQRLIVGAKNENPTDASDEAVKKKKKEIADYERHQKKALRDVNLANPKKQVVIVFGTLLASGAFLATYYLFRSNYFNMYQLFWLKLFTLLISFGFFLFAMITIGLVYYLMVDLKQKEYEQEQREKQTEGLSVETENNG